VKYRNEEWFLHPRKLCGPILEYIFNPFAEMPVENYVGHDKLIAMKEEFDYWYPVDLRVSGKDLLRNHLAMCLYTHAEIWRDSPRLWPRAIRTNGHLLLNQQKMSKSTGNFLLLSTAIQTYGADAVRFALADAGDAVEEDANFSENTADKAVLKLYNLAVNAEALKTAKLRNRDPDGIWWFEMAIENEMRSVVEQAKKAYDRLQFRDALQYAFFDMQKLRDTYANWCRLVGVEPLEDLTMAMLRTQVLMMSPITPHICEHIYANIIEHMADRGGDNKPATAVEKKGTTPKTYSETWKWPEVKAPDPVLSSAFNFLQNALNSFREQLYGGTAKQGAGRADRNSNDPTADATNSPLNLPTRARIDVVVTEAPLRTTVIEMVRRYTIQRENGMIALPTDFLTRLKSHVLSDSFLRPKVKEILQIAAYIRGRVESGDGGALRVGLPFDQREVLEQNREYLLASLNLEDVRINICDPYAADAATGMERGHKERRRNIKKQRNDPSCGKPTIVLDSCQT